jgi:hypothetical protein
MEFVSFLLELTNPGESAARQRRFEGDVFSLAAKFLQSRKHYPARIQRRAFGIEGR